MSKEKTFEELIEMVRGMSDAETEMLRLAVETKRVEQEAAWEQWSNTVSDNEVDKEYEKAIKSMVEAGRQWKEYLKKHHPFTSGEIERHITKYPVYELLYGAKEE
jgi:hypothetical protein